MGDLDDFVIKDLVIHYQEAELFPFFVNCSSIVSQPSRKSRVVVSFRTDYGNPTVRDEREAYGNAGHSQAKWASKAETAKRRPKVAPAVFLPNSFCLPIIA